MTQWCLYCDGDASAPDHWRTCDGRQGRIEAELDITGMVHRGDPHTSAESALVIARRRTELHAKVLDAFRSHGRMNDEQLEQLPEFYGYGPSTIRKRRSELYQQHAIVSVGDCVNSRGRKMLIWDLGD